MGEVGGDGLGEEVEGVLFALAAGSQDGQQGLDEAAAGGAWGVEAELFPAILEASSELVFSPTSDRRRN